jgi:hypothetical protein
VLEREAAGGLTRGVTFARLSALADNWHVQVRAKDGNKAHQALAFLPNELWIHAAAASLGLESAAKFFFVRAASVCWITRKLPIANPHFTNRDSGHIV